MEATGCSHIIDKDDRGATCTKCGAIWTSREFHSYIELTSIRARLAEIERVLKLRVHQ
jgi:hypothetical protein